MRTDAHCKGCGEPIRWAMTEATGKRMPLNPDVDPAGNVWVLRYAADRTPIVAVASLLEPIPDNEPLRYTSHFATCENAAEFRRPG